MKPLASIYYTNKENPLFTEYCNSKFDADTIGEMKFFTNNLADYANIERSKKLVSFIEKGDREKLPLVEKDFDIKTKMTTRHLAYFSFAAMYHCYWVYTHVGSTQGGFKSFINKALQPISR